MPFSLVILYDFSAFTLAEAEIFLETGSKCPCDPQRAVFKHSLAAV